MLKKNVIGFLLLLASPAFCQDASPAPAAESSPTPAPGANPEPIKKAEDEPAKNFDWIVGGQANFIAQHIGDFRSPYSGANSLRSENNTEVSELYTIFLGVRVCKGLEFYLDPELATGHGLSQGFGTAGYVNGDVIRNPALGGRAYFGRYFARYTVSTGPGTENQERQASSNQIGGERPAHRLVFTLGKFGVNDIFDQNRYANSSRTQFLNWSFINNLAWDFPADTRGYTQGLTVAWEHPDWAVRAGASYMPTVANGPDLASFPKSRGINLELELHPRILGGDNDPAIVRILGFHNTANMGNYQEAVEIAQRQGTIPDIGSVDHSGRSKGGFTLNLEQPLADDGDTGVFMRYGWSDGQNESYAYTECDSTFSIGGQISGKNWDRPKDRIGIGLAQNVIFGPHRDYLAAGGKGFILGDGALSYAPERIAELYYWWQMTDYTSLTLDMQYIQDPGYNHDRGPVFVPGLRFHIEY